jgi:hypothetical protein
VSSADASDLADVASRQQGWRRCGDQGRWWSQHIAHERMSAKKWMAVIGSWWWSASGGGVVWTDEVVSICTQCSSVLLCSREPLLFFGVVFIMVEMQLHTFYCNSLYVIHVGCSSIL